MANKNQNAQTDIMVETKGKLELFFEKFGMKILWVLVIVGVLVGAFFVWKGMQDKKEAELQGKASAALGKAISEDGTLEQFAKIEKDYAETPAANSAAYVAGIKALQDGDLAAAKSHLAKYQNVEGIAGEMVNAQVYGAYGDIAVNEGDYEKAVGLFKKAINASDDKFTCETYSHKLALVYNKLDKKAEAVKCYEDMVAKYPELKNKYSKYIY